MPLRTGPMTTTTTTQTTGWRQGLTLVHFSAQRKHICVGYVGCMISPQSIRQGDTERRDQNGLG